MPTNDMTVAKFTRRLLRLERDFKTYQVTPRLGNSSIDDGGAIVINDPISGNPQVIIGGQHDDINTVNYVGGPKPPTPTAPTVTPTPAGLRISWDGRFLGDIVDPVTGDVITPVVAPSDFQRVTFHAVPVDPNATPVTPTLPDPNDPHSEAPPVILPDFSPLDPAYLVGEITTANGGERTPGLVEETDYLVYSVTWTRAGKFSDPSAPVAGTPITTVTPAEMAEAKANAEAAATAAVDAQAAAEDARQKALAAAGQADDAGQAALDAANAAAAAQQAADDAAAAGSSNYTELLAVANAAQSAADAANVAATAAAQAADAAGALATGAQNSASGKSVVRYSTALPGTTSNTVGDTWFQISAVHGRTISTWRGLGGTAWVQQTLDGAVISNIDIGTATVGVLSGLRVNAEELVIGALPLPDVLSSKETPAGAQSKADTAALAAQSAAISAAATDAANKASSAQSAAQTYAAAQAEAARLAAIATSSGDATDKAEAARAAAVASAATDALNKANAARDAAISAASTDAQTRATQAKTDAISAASTASAAQAEAARLAAIATASGDATDKAEAARAAALASATTIAVDQANAAYSAAQSYANTQANAAREAAEASAAIDAQQKADTALAAAKAALADIETGNANLVSGGDYETQAQVSVPQYSLDQGLVAIFDDAHVRSGTRSVKMVGGAGHDGFVESMYDFPNRFKKGVQYVTSEWIWIGDPGNDGDQSYNNRVMHYVFDGSTPANPAPQPVQTQLGEPNVYGAATITQYDGFFIAQAPADPRLINQWQRVYVTWIPTSDIPGNAVSPRSYAAAHATIWRDQFQIEEGNTPSGWKPSRAEAEAALAAAAAADATAKANAAREAAEANAAIDAANKAATAQAQAISTASADASTKASNAQQAAIAAAATDASAKASTAQQAAIAAAGTASAAQAEAARLAAIATSSGDATDKAAAAQAAAIAQAATTAQAKADAAYNAAKALADAAQAAANAALRANPNLVRNGDASNGTTGWGNVNVSTAKTIGGGPVFQGHQEPSNWSYISQSVEEGVTLRGKQITISAMILAGVEGQTATVYLNEIGASGTIINSRNGGVVPISTTTPTLVTGTFDVGPDTVRFDSYNCCVIGPGGDFYFDNAKTEIGATATAWSAHPAEAAERATALAAAAQAAAIGTAAGDATAKAAAAQAAAALDASNKAAAAWGGQSLNPTFDNWPASNGWPDGTGQWVGQPIRETSLVRTAPAAVRFSIGAGVESGIVLNPGDGIMGQVTPSEYLTVTTDFMLVAGGLEGAGVLVDWQGGNSGLDNRARIRLQDEVLNPTLNRWYRVTKTIKRPPGQEGSTYVGGYLMGGWSGIAGVTAKDIIYDRLDWRPASAEEISAYESVGRIATAKVEALAAVDGSYATTKALVGGWVVTGKTTINGGKLETDSVLAGAIKAGEIQTKHLAAEVADFIDVRAQTIAAATAKIGFVLTGKIQVGTSTWTPTEGLIFPGVMILPSQAGQPASFTGGITATTLTVQKDFNLYGNTNKIAGTLTLANGVTRPTSSPVIYQSWQQVGAARDMAFGQIHYGLTTHLSDSSLFVTATAFYGGGCSGIVKATNASFYLHDPKPWGSGGPIGFNPTGGITTLAGSYWVLGQDSARDYGWYIYRLNATFDKTGELYVGANGAIPGRPTLGNDGTYLTQAYANGASSILFGRWNPNTMQYASSNEFATFSNIGATALSSFNIGNYDFGTQRAVIAVEANANFVTDTNGGRLSDTYLFLPANGTKVRGLCWDAASQQFYSWGADGTLWIHGKNIQSQTLSASFTFYDGDSAGTGQHETEETTTPLTGFIRGARTLITVRGDEAPDTGVTAAGTPDKANRIGIYVGVDGGARRLQGYNGVGSDGRSVRDLTLNVINTGSATPPNTNGFAGAANSPGIIKSFGATTGQGFILNGDGSGQWGKLQVTAAGGLNIGAITPLQLSGPWFTTVPTAGQGTVFTMPTAGTLVGVVSGAGFGVAVGNGALQIYIDGVFLGQSLYYHNVASDHRVYPSFPFVMSLAAGTHRFAVKSNGVTASDANDACSLSGIVLPG